MYDITLVCTHHSELGSCTSDALYKIIDLLKPEIIFEELPQSLFDLYYVKNDIRYVPPEVKAVKRYVESYGISHFPVDIEVSDDLSTAQIRYLFGAFKKYRDYSRIEDIQNKLIFEEGYSFLNSDENEQIVETKKNLEKSSMEFEVNKVQLVKMHRLFYDEQNKREEEIVKNVYKYSEGRIFNHGVLLIGSGHRRSIFEKIKQFDPEMRYKLKWTLYGS